MDNLTKIKKLSRHLYYLISFLLIAIPLYYVCYWAFINHLPAQLITVNVPSTSLIPHKLSFSLQFVGFMVSFLPLSALIYGLLNIRKLFTFYKKGVIFSFEHVIIFRNTAKALIVWVFLSMVYESSKSVLFSIGNPPGSRVIEVGFNSLEISTLLVGSVAFIVAWVMDEGRILREESELTI